MNKLQLSEVNPGSFSSENTTFELIKTFNNSLIDFSEQHLKIFVGKEEKPFETDLEQKIGNPFMVTYIGTIEPRTSFRVILSPEMVQRTIQSELAIGEPDLITFASMSGEGFAVHFKLINSDNHDTSNFKESLGSAFFKSNTESKAEALIYAAVDVYSIDPNMAMDYINRFSKLIEADPFELLKFQSIENIFVGYDIGLELGLFEEDYVCDTIQNMELVFVSSKHLGIDNNVTLKCFSDDPQGYIHYETIIRIVPNFDIKKGYLVSINNQDSNHPFWGDQCPLKVATMGVISKSRNKIVLDFVDFDSDFTDIEIPILTINISGKEIESIIFHGEKYNKLMDGTQVITIDMKYLK